MAQNPILAESGWAWLGASGGPDAALMRNGRDGALRSGYMHANDLPRSRPASACQGRAGKRYSGWTVPFASAKQRSVHFAKHGHEFGATDEFDYERIADAFMSLAWHPNLFECVNQTGDQDRIRLDASTRYFGVAYHVTVVRTLHIRSANSIASKGGPLAFVIHKCSEVHP